MICFPFAKGGNVYFKMMDFVYMLYDEFQVIANLPFIGDIKSCPMNGSITSLKQTIRADQDYVTILGYLEPLLLIWINSNPSMDM